MSAIWRWLVAFLVWLSADRAHLQTEPGRAAAAVAVARAAILEEMQGKPMPPAPPGPEACRCGQTCVKGRWRPDGRIDAACPCQCGRCVAERAKGLSVVSGSCSSGTCPPR